MEHISIDECISCTLCGNYSEPLRERYYGDFVCVDFESCVINRLEDGLLSEAEAKELLNK